jgi:hypothetical protein
MGDLPSMVNGVCVGLTLAWMSIDRNSQSFKKNLHLIHLPVLMVLIWVPASAAFGALPFNLFIGRTIAQSDLHNWTS